MQGTESTRRSARHAAVVWALLIASACGPQAFRPANPVGPTTSTPAPTPTPRVWKDLGEYAVTMTVAPSCSLPDYAMTRTYNARLKESGPDLVAEFDDPHFVAWGPAGFTGTTDGETVRFTLNGDYGKPVYSFVYLVNDSTELGYTGAATGNMGDSVIVATLNGTVVLCSYHDHKEFARCDAPDHRMELARK